MPHYWTAALWSLIHFALIFLLLTSIAFSSTSYRAGFLSVSFPRNVPDSELMPNE